MPIAVLFLVLVITGLIIGGVFAGKKLISSSRIRENSFSTKKVLWKIFLMNISFYVVVNRVKKFITFYNFSDNQKGRYNVILDYTDNLLSSCIFLYTIILFYKITVNAKIEKKYTKTILKTLIFITVPLIFVNAIFGLFKMLSSL